MPYKSHTKPLMLPFAALFLALVSPIPAKLCAQTPVAAPAPARQLGTVKSISGNTITIAPTTGAPVAITVAPSAPVLQLPPGSTDLKSATPATLDQIAVGDRILATGKPADLAGATPGAILASRIILMKSSDLTARSEQQQADWQRTGVSGLVKSADGANLTVSAGARTVTVQTTPTTVFRRYADDSINFGQAKLATLAQVLPGDQLSARGAHSEDNLSVTAEEIVFGSFTNLSGLVTAVNPTAGTVALRDLATKKSVTVKITGNSDLRNLPPQAAASFAARNNPNSAALSQASGANPAGAASGRSAGAYGAAPGGPGSGGGPSPGGSGAGGRARAGMDLSRMLARLPAEPLTALKPGQAVMIVASQATVGSGDYTAITLLSGVEQLLSSTAPGAQPITLSPWNLSAPEGGGGGGGGGPL